LDILLLFLRNSESESELVGSWGTSFSRALSERRALDLESDVAAVSEAIEVFHSFCSSLGLSLELSAIAMEESLMAAW